MKIIWLSLLTLIATVIDWLSINSGLAEAIPLFHYLGWTAVFLLCYLILRKFRWSFLATIVIAVVEDFLYLIYASVIGQRAFWPVYSHSWMTEAYGSWVKPFAQNWLGLPSFYYVVLAIVVVVITLSIRRSKDVTFLR